MLKLIYPACFYPNGSGYTVVVPDLPGCVTEGENIADAIEMAVDAASGWILDSIECGESIPAATTDISKIPLEYPDGTVNFILLDMEDYAEKHSHKAVRKQKFNTESTDFVGAFIMHKIRKGGTKWERNMTAVWYLIRI